MGQSPIIIPLNSLKGEETNNNIKWPLDTFLSHLKEKVLTTNFIFLELSRKEKKYKKILVGHLILFLAHSKQKQ
jgi:hypothetical protein